MHTAAALGALIAVGAPFAAHSEEDGTSGGDTAVDEVLVTASRLPTTAEGMPVSVTLIDEAQLSSQLEVTSDLGAILGNLVPGMSTSSQSPANFHQTLRGRTPVYLIDGVPITPTLNSVGREARLIDPATIARIEVVRGSSALYGNSAGAGFINYITKPPEEGPLTVDSEIGLQTSLTSPGDGLRPSVHLSAYGGDRVDFRVAGYYEKTSGFYDADGDRIAPIPNGFSGLADSDIYSLFARAGFDINDTSRLEVTASHYRQKQDTDYKLLPGDVSEGIKATAIRKTPEDIEEADQAHENTLVNLAYADSDVFGSSARLQVFYQRSESVFGMEFGRFPLTSKPDGQSKTSSEKAGYRIDIHTPMTFLGDDAELIWGSDFLNDETVAGLVDGRTFAPTQEIDSLAFFAQLRASFIDDFVTFTGGVRHESTDLTVPDFQSLFTLAHLTGGTLDYSATPVNFGLSFALTDAVELFAGLSQGFEVTSIARTFRSTPIDVNLSITQPDPNEIDNRELGLRGTWSSVVASFAVFDVESTEGQSFTVDPNNRNNVFTRTFADEMYGYEATLDASLNDRWTAGGSFSWIEGKSDPDLDGDYDTPLQNRRIPPRKITGYVQAEVDDWTLRAQVLYSGSRNKFPGSTNFWEGEIHSWTVVDVSASGEMGPGVLTVGVNNLLNEDYFTHISESAQQDNRYSKAQGATAMIRYRWEF
ncbi:MAG TPA: TonB-dependent receptor [Woeseiaceae bacterium]|nr:TonB-dependent receptor [Woeseiaceae bacterium]